jgi:hypothetical protein
VSAQVSIKVSQDKKVTGVHLLVNDSKPPFEIKEDKILLTVPQIYDHEIIGIDLT